MPRPKTFDASVALRRATDLFWKQGYHATSIQELLDYLGINRSSLYETFGSKRELFLSALDAYRAGKRESLGELAEDADAYTALLRIFRRAAELGGRGCLTVNATTELVPEDEDVSRQLRLDRSETEGLFATLLRRGMAEGQFRGDLDVELAARSLFVYYSGLCATSKLEENREDAGRAAEALVRRICQ